MSAQFKRLKNRTLDNLQLLTDYNKIDSNDGNPFSVIKIGSIK